MKNELYNLLMSFQKSPRNYGRDLPEHILIDILAFGWLAGRAGVAAGEVTATLKSPVARSAILAEALGKSWVDQAEVGNKILDKAADHLERMAQKNLQDNLGHYEYIKTNGRPGEPGS